MKKILCLMLMVCLICGCSPIESEFNNNTEEAVYITGVWISYAELDNMLAGDFKEEFKNAVGNCKTRNVTDVYVHVRPFCDSVYPSAFFPLREGVKKYSFDVLEYMIKLCHESNIRFHAWINPYRVKTSDGELSNISPDSPALKWLNDDDAENDANVVINNGIYLNPASNNVRQLVIDGVREIVNKYKVDGIHFDDYFYPTQDEAFDALQYAEYCGKTQSPLTLSNWRRNNVDLLISGVYTAIKFKSKDIVFSVSPSASIEENYTKHYADITTWANSGCLDYVIPQLYFGFNYPQPKFQFNALISDWKKVIKNSDTKLLIGLAAYKINTDSQPDKSEWSNGKEVIEKQIEVCKENEDIKGHIFFSYSSMVKYIK